MAGNDQVLTQGGVSVTILGSGNGYKVEGTDAVGAVATGMPVQMGALDSGGTMHPTLVDGSGGLLSGFVGTHANLWNGATIVTSGTSPVIDLHAVPFVAVFGHLSAAGTATIMASQNGTAFYATGTALTATGAADVYSSITFPARYLECVVTAGSAVVTLSAVGKS